MPGGGMPFPRGESPGPTAPPRLRPGLCPRGPQGKAGSKWASEGPADPVLLPEDGPAGGGGYRRPVPNRGARRNGRAGSRPSPALHCPFQKAAQATCTACLGSDGWLFHQHPPPPPFFSFLESPVFLRFMSGSFGAAGRWPPPGPAGAGRPRGRGAAPRPARPRKGRGDGDRGHGAAV